LSCGTLASPVPAIPFVEPNTEVAARLPCRTFHILDRKPNPPENGLMDLG